MTAPRAMPKVSVVIPARNEQERLPRQLAALSKQRFPGPWEVIVADNGSTDRTTRIARDWRGPIPSLTVVDASRAPGINVARNEGVRVASAGRIVLCDADDRVHPDWLARLYAGLDHAGLVAGRLEIEAVNDPRVSALRSWRFERLRPSFGFMPSAAGANCGFRRSVFDAVGGFDETFTGGCDEIDFFWRAQLTGYELAFVEDAVVDYHFRPRAWETVRQLHTQAIQQPHLYRKFHDAGMSRPGAAAVARRWLWIMAALPLLPLSAPRRRAWLRLVATTSGRLRGSVRYRTLYL